MKRTETQNEQILNFLLTGCALTGIEALEMFKTMKIATRVSELRRAGYDIQKTWVKTSTGKMVMSYSLKA